MPSSFNMQNMPFSLLSEVEQRQLRSGLDICYFQAGETVMKAGDEPEGVYVILKGSVSESDEAQPGESKNIFVHYQDEDYFGAWSALRGQSIHNFIAEQETICHLIPIKLLLELVASNATFADYFQQTLAVKTEIVEQQGGSQDMTEFMLARIDSGVIREPLVVLEGTSIREATGLMREHKADCLLVRRGNRYGMVTGTDILDAVVMEQRPASDDVADIASYRLISAGPEEYLFNALITMTQQKIERIVVMQGEQLLGVVELTDVLSFFSSHSHVIGLRIERAQTVEDLREASIGLDELIHALVARGVKTRFAMDLLAAMNGRIMAKLFELVVPADMMPHLCLIVMGSEGRGEQIVKTDQDNAVIYRDGLDWPAMQSTLNEFSAQLESFGYPPCPGGIMVCNSQWVNSLGDWTARLGDWSNSCEGEAQMNLAIAIDAKPVAGNPALFKAARNWLHRQLKGNGVFFSHFARAAVEFDTPLTFFGNLKDRGHLDVKKGGIFPIVHGVRAIALEHKVLETNTFKRIEALVEAQVIKPADGRELAEALSLFVQLRLTQQLQRSREGADETPNLIELQSLDKLERELLRDAFHIVKGFKKHLELRYHLNR